MNLFVGKDYHTQSPILLKSINVNYITSPVGQGKTILFLNILKELQKENVNIHVCCDYREDTHAVASMQTDYSGITKVTNDIESTLSDLFFILNDRKVSSEQEHTPVVFMFDVSLGNNKELESILQTPNEVFEKLNIHIIISKQLLRLKPDNVDSVNKQSEHGFLEIGIKRKMVLDGDDSTTLGFELLINSNQGGIELRKVQLQNLKIKHQEII